MPRLLVHRVCRICSHQESIFWPWLCPISACISVSEHQISQFESHGFSRLPLVSSPMQRHAQGRVSTSPRRIHWFNWRLAEARSRLEACPVAPDSGWLPLDQSLLQSRQLRLYTCGYRAASCLHKALVRMLVLHSACMVGCYTGSNNTEV